MVMSGTPLPVMSPIAGLEWNACSAHDRSSPLRCQRTAPDGSMAKVPPPPHWLPSADPLPITTSSRTGAVEVGGRGRGVDRVRGAHGPPGHVRPGQLRRRRTPCRRGRRRRRPVGPGWRRNGRRLPERHAREPPLPGQERGSVGRGRGLAGWRSCSLTSRRRTDPPERACIRRVRRDQEPVRVSGPRRPPSRAAADTEGSSTVSLSDRRHGRGVERGRIRGDAPRKSGDAPWPTPVPPPTARTNSKIADLRTWAPHPGGIIEDMSEARLAGRLLVATPSLRDPNFARTVVLLLDHGPDGAPRVVSTDPLTRRSRVPFRSGGTGPPSRRFGVRRGSRRPPSAICLAGLCGRARRRRRAGSHSSTASAPSTSAGIRGGRCRHRPAAGLRWSRRMGGGSARRRDRGEDVVRASG